MLNYIPVILGPTGIGKSSYALKLALELGGEIISCDSRQIYKKMNIGTAKPDKTELSLVKHHIINILDPKKEYGAGQWVNDANLAIDSILDNNKIPIICGGTFYYLSALTNGFDSTTKPDMVFREEMLLLEEKKNGVLYEKLQEVAPYRAEKLHPNDIQRIIRALQIERDGATLVLPSKYTFKIIELTSDRENIYNRINSRVDKMIEDGLYQEFESLINDGYNKDSAGLKCVGYKEFFNYIEGVETFENAVEEIKKNSRRYAKKQLTWLRNSIDNSYKIDISEIINFDKDKFIKLLGEICE